MKNIIRKFFLYKYTECDALKEYLEDIAQKGWILKDINTFLTFEKAEPQKLTYSVEVFEKASIFDTQVEDKAREYIDYCQEAGWQFVCNKEKIHIFVTADENVVPIETDETLKYHTIKKSMLKQNAYQWFVQPFLLTYIVLLPYFSCFELFITSYVNVLTLLILILNLIIFGSQIISFCLWCRWARKNLANGEPLPSYNQNDLKRRSMIRMIPIVLALVVTIGVGIVSFINTDYSSGWFLILSVGVVILIWGITIWYQKKKLDRATNIILPVILGISISGVFMTFCIAFVVGFSHENPMVYVEGNALSVVGRSEIPLKLEDLDISPDKYRDTNKNIYSTMFAKYTTYEDNTSNELDGNQNGISYSMFESNYDFIINQYVNNNINKSYENYKGSDASIWNTEKTFYSDNTHSYMVIYKNCVFIFESDLPLNDTILTTIKEKLNLKKYINSLE